jgi:hypothetical protein
MATFGTQIDTVAMPYGPTTFGYSKVFSLQCKDPGPYTFSVRVECPGGYTGGSMSQTINLNEQKPTIGNYDASIDSELCTFQASAAYHSPCGVKDATWTAEIYHHKGTPSGLGGDDLVGGPSPLPCGIGDGSVSANGNVSGQGTHYFTFVLKKNGAVDSTVVKAVDCFGCEPTETPVYVQGNQVPYNSIAETIWLVKPVKSASGFTYQDQRCLSVTYKMIDWWYYRNGGCGPFDIVLGEDFPELENALQGQYEIHVRIQLPTDSAFTTWYRGIIRAGERRQKGTDIVTELRGTGYNALLAETYVARRYPKGLTADQIINDLIDNYIKPNSKIVRPRDVDNTRSGTVGTGVDPCMWVTKGPIHFECSVLKAVKFLAELEGGMEFGVAADTSFFFRKKLTGAATTNALFVGKDLTDVVDAGKEVQKVNQIRVEGKGFSQREFSAIVGDPTDITKYGMFERQIEVPWIEHQADAVQWANNIIQAKRDISPWKTITWDSVNARLEKAQPNTAMDRLRVYDNQTSTTAYNDYDINKIHYYKGWIPGRGEIREKRRPRSDNNKDNPELRAVVTTGFHHHDLVEELEEKLFDQLGAVKGKLQQFRNMFSDVTLPYMFDVSLYAGQMQALTKQGLFSPDVTNGPVKPNFFDGTRWVDLITMRSGEQLPVSGDFPGQQFMKWTNSSHTIGDNYYWTGFAWTLISGTGTYVIPSAHAFTHEDGGSDQIDVTNLHGLLADPQQVIVQKAAANIGTRKRLNLIPGTNVTLVVVDNPGSDRVDITITAAGGGTSGGDIRSDGSVAFAANESMGGNKITNLADPTTALDAANKEYVDTAALAGFDAIHEPVFWMLMG